VLDKILGKEEVDIIRVFCKQEDSILVMGLLDKMEWRKNRRVGLSGWDIQYMTLFFPLSYFQK
jgi:hypothetical protein